jgi:hypothetical protein
LCRKTAWSTSASSTKKEQDEAEERNRAEERRMEQAKREAERERLKIEAEAKAKAEARQAALDAAQQRQQAILAQPPVGNRIRSQSHPPACNLGRRCVKRTQQRAAKQ